MDKIKKVLILCDAFPPAFNPRMGYLCKYLPELGWQSIIVTEYSPQNFYANLSENQDITPINFYFSKNKLWLALRYIFVFLSDFLFDYKAMMFEKKTKKIIENNNISLILSTSSCRVFSALAAQKLSVRYNIPFVMDLRDISEQFPNNEHISKKILLSKTINNILATIITKRFLCGRNKILPKADVVTTVSEWHCEILSKYNNNINLVYNGFDHNLFYPKKITTNTFTITYTGRIESIDIKDPSLFFKVVKNLQIEKNIDFGHFKIQFYLTDKKSKEIVKMLAEEHKITNLIDIFDAIQSSEIPQILNESSVLLLLANSSIGDNAPKGIMGTKLFEYLAVEKPILCVRNDEDCLERTIKQANAGLAASTTDEVEQFILEKYAEWQQNGNTHQAVNREFVEQFSRKHQAEQFVAIFEHFIR